MGWSVDISESAARELDALHVDLQQQFMTVVDLLVANGPEKLGEPYVRHVESNLWQMRIEHQDHKPHVAYFESNNRSIIVL